MKSIATSALVLISLAVASFVSCIAKADAPVAKRDSSPPNGGFEESAANGMPAHWEPLIIGAPAQFALDSEQKHSGQHSARLTASEVTRAYFATEWMPIAPGEKIHVSAWVKHKDVPPGKGTVILIAGFSDAKQRNESVAKVNTADTWIFSPGAMGIHSVAK
jgi:hypothetical protein